MNFFHSSNELETERMFNFKIPERPKGSLCCGSPESTALLPAD